MKKKYIFLVSIMVMSIFGTTLNAQWNDPQPLRAKTDITVYLEGLYKESTGLLSDSLWKSGKFRRVANDTNIAAWPQPLQRDWSNVTRFDTIPLNIGVIPAGWVQMELYSIEMDSTGQKPLRQYHQEGIVSTKGKVLDVNGYEFTWNVYIGYYYIIIRSINHLAIMSASPLYFFQEKVEWDFTDSQYKTYGGKEAVKLLPNSDKWGMMAGDVCPAYGYGKGHDRVVDLNDQIYILNRRGLPGGHWASDMNSSTKVTDDDYLLCNANWFAESFAPYYGKPWPKEPLGPDNPEVDNPEYGYTITAGNFRPISVGVMDFDIHVQASVDSLYLGAAQLIMKIDPDYFHGFQHIFGTVELNPSPFIIDTTFMFIHEDEIQIVILPRDFSALYHVNNISPELLLKVRLWTDLGAFSGNLNPRWKNSGSGSHTQFWAKIPQTLYTLDVTDSNSHRIDFPTGIIENLIPSNYSLSQNYPNPFNPTTIINYSIPQKEVINFIVYDVIGREVFKQTINQIAGQNSIKFNGANLSSGMYYYKMEAGEFTETKKMMLIR